MKRWIALFLALGMIFALAGCKASQTTQDPAAANADTNAPATEEPSANVTAPELLPPPSSASPEAAPEQGDESGAWDGLTSAYDLVQNGHVYDYDRYSYHIPTILAETAGAQAINAAINERYTTEALSSEQAIAEQADPDIIPTMLERIDWYLTVWERVISLTVFVEYDYEFTEYEVYYYDMDSGEQLTNRQVLERIVLTEEEFLEGTRAAVRTAFEEKFASLPEETREASGYYDLLSRIDTNEFVNLELVKFAVDEGVVITVYAPVPSIAGAGYYYQELYPSFHMG